jgi:hypothetical protein
LLLARRIVNFVTSGGLEGAGSARAGPAAAWNRPHRGGVQGGRGRRGLRTLPCEAPIAQSLRPDPRGLGATRGGVRPPAATCSAGLIAHSFDWWNHRPCCSKRRGGLRPSSPASEQSPAAHVSTQTEGRDLISSPGPADLGRRPPAQSCCPALDGRCGPGPDVSVEHQGSRRRDCLQ